MEGGRGKEGSKGEKCGVKETFLMTTHHISEGHKSHKNALQSQYSIHFLMHQNQHVLCYAITTPSIDI